MSDARKLFRIVVWLGVAANYAFGLWVTFLDPHRLLLMMGLGDQASVLWLYNYSILLMILSLFYLPAARDPFRYRANAWLLVLGRLLPVSTFIVGVMLGFMPRGFLGLAAVDGTVGILELILLIRIFREGPDPATIGRATMGGLFDMRGRRIAYIVALILGAIIVVAPPAYDRLFPRPTHYASEVDHFKYGSVGVEPVQGLPFEVWRALPGICMPPGERAAGYARFGFQWDAGHTSPIGMPRETAIVPRVGVNCALCHVGRVIGPDGVAQQIVGAPNTTLDLQAYLRFLYRCANSDQFAAGPILDEIDRQGGNLNPFQKLLYRFVIIPQTRSAMLAQQRELSFTDRHPDWGPGRAAGFNPAKVQVLKRPYDGTLDTVDFPPLWAMEKRHGGGYHWDGLQTSLHEVFLNSGIGNGASPRSINVPNLDRMERWVNTLPAARYPFAIDRRLAAAGEPLYVAHCADCHAPGGGKTGEVIPIGWVNTDRNRLDAWTPDALQAFSSAAQYTWKYEHFRKTNGYLATPLDGIWARAPYLHNGSVPTLAAMLSDPAARPVTFGRGSALYDPRGVGFSSARGKLYDTRAPGNGNGGHLYGVGLSPPEKAALLEYLKTL